MYQATVQKLTHHQRRELEMRLGTTLMAFYPIEDSTRLKRIAELLVIAITPIIEDAATVAVRTKEKPPMPF